VGGARWANYFSKNVVNFQGAGVACVGLFLLAELAVRVGLAFVFGGRGSGFVYSLVGCGVFLACFACYWFLDRRYTELPERGWDRASDRRSARPFGGKRRRSVGWATALVLLTVCSFLVFGAERWGGVSAIAAAAWLSLHRRRAGSLWSHYAWIAWGLVVAGMPALAFPGTFEEGLRYVLAGAGAALVVGGISEHRVFQRYGTGRS
jgi:hypothetical protein